MVVLQHFSIEQTILVVAASAVVDVIVNVM